MHFFPSESALRNISLIYTETHVRSIHSIIKVNATRMCSMYRGSHEKSKSRNISNENVMRSAYKMRFYEACFVKYGGR
jgi:hypothetical protein